MAIPVAAETVTLAVALFRKPAGLNRTEARYHDHLVLRQHREEIVAFRFHDLTFKLGDDTRYTPEALVIRPDGTVELHEVKGFMRDDARVKLHTAARQYPWFRWILVREERDKTWTLKEVQP